MSSLKFFSNSLCRDVLLTELGGLTKDQLADLHKELAAVVVALDATVQEAHSKASASGIPADKNWLHRIATKKRIALKFAAEAHSQLQGGTTIEQREEYERIYRAKLRTVLENEFGKQEYRELEREVRKFAVEQYKQWIAQTNQRAWYQP